MENKYVIVIGNPFDGMTVVGPFDDPDTASAYGEDQEDDWWIVTLQKPEVRKEGS